MKIAIIALMLVAAASAMPQKFVDVIPVLSRTETRDSSGQFMLEYTTGDGVLYRETGHLVLNNEGDGYVLVKEGTITYTSPEGIPITLSYIADKDGFRPVGDHLPKSVVA